MTTDYIAAWRLQLQPGSFRNIPFGIRSAQTEVGRRVAIHEYPQRDEVFPEDLGLQADKFTVEAIVVGPDYMTARDALIDALKAPGPGLLIHPYYGARMVSLTAPARIAESPEEGGMARFSLEFVDAGENDQPAEEIDTQGAVEAAADEALEAIAEDFELSFDIDGLPDFSISGALEMAKGAMASISAAITGLVPDMSALADLQAAAGRLAGDIGGLLRAPMALAQGVMGQIGGLLTVAQSPLRALSALRDFFDFGGTFDSIRADKPACQREQSNQTAQAALIRRTAIVEGARAASRALPAPANRSRALDGAPTTVCSVLTYDVACVMRDDLAASLDDEAAGIVPAARGNDPPSTMQIDVSEPVYRALIFLRAALVRDLTERVINAPRIIRVSLPVTMPALVAAHRVYRDATRADDLIARNARSIRHPGFVPGGVELETIS
jgi:prophage DNA circulation protein